MTSRPIRYVISHTRENQIALPLRGRPILLITRWLQTELDSTQSHHHYLLSFLSLLNASSKRFLMSKQFRFILQLYLSSLFFPSFSAFPLIFFCILFSFVKSSYFLCVFILSVLSFIVFFIYSHVVVKICSSSTELLRQQSLFLKRTLSNGIHG